MPTKARCATWHSRTGRSGSCAHAYRRLETRHRRGRQTGEQRHRPAGTNANAGISQLTIGITPTAWSCQERVVRSSGKCMERACRDHAADRTGFALMARQRPAAGQQRSRPDAAFGKAADGEITARDRRETDAIKTVQLLHLAAPRPPKLHRSSRAPRQHGAAMPDAETGKRGRRQQAPDHRRCREQHGVDRHRQPPSDSSSATPVQVAAGLAQARWRLARTCR